MPNATTVLPTFTGDLAAWHKARFRDLLIRHVNGEDQSEAELEDLLRYCERFPGPSTQFQGDA